jgi:hypothetical protein
LANASGAEANANIVNERLINFFMADLP